MPEVTLSSPWVIYARETKALFEYDDEVEVVYDDEPALRLLVSNPTKADAIAKIMPMEMTFGGVTMPVSVIPANDEVTTDQTIRTAFEGNPAFTGTLVDDVRGNTYAVFEPEVAQFYSDDISSPFGAATMTYEQLAKAVLNVDAFICSDLIDYGTGSPLGEWP